MIEETAEQPNSMTPMNSVKTRTTTPSLLFGLLVLLTIDLDAQVVLQPSLGLQTISFMGEPLASLPMSPGQDRAQPLGGDLSGAQAGFRLQAELMTDKDAIIRIPVALEYFGLNGKTTFSITRRDSLRRSQRWTFTHDASILTANIGATAAFFKKQKLYISAELKGVYFPATNLNSRIYYADNDSTIQESPDLTPMESTFRIGGFVRAGAQLPFFDPFTLDFSAGIGILNMGLKGNSNLLTIDPQEAVEQNLRYFSIGMSLVYML